MTMVLADPDPDWLAERSERGIDRWDEVWDGVLHVPPTPVTQHQRFESDLERTLRPVVEALGLEILHQVAVFDPEKGLNNYRTPDLVIATSAAFSRRGVEGQAELAVEILSPNDESRKKFAFYAARGIAEYWIVDPETREIEIYVLRDGAYFAVLPNDAGMVRSARLGLELRVVEGPKLRIAWADGSAEI